MRFYTDPSAPLVDVTWQFCQPGAKPLGVWTPFCSRNWEPNGVPPGLLGEDRTQPVPWYRGGRLQSATGRGPFCGTADQWLNGQPLPPVPPIVTLPDGTPACCVHAGLEPVFWRWGLGVSCRFRHGEGFHGFFHRGLGVKFQDFARAYLSNLLGMRAADATMFHGVGFLSALFGKGLGMKVEAFGKAYLNARLALVAGELTHFQATSMFMALIGLQERVRTAGQALATFTAHFGLSEGYATFDEAAAAFFPRLGLDVPPMLTGKGLAEFFVVLGAYLSMRGVYTAIADIAVQAGVEQGYLPAFTAEGIEKATAGDKLSVSMAFASFEMDTPVGGCGSLPHDLVMRLSGGSGTCGCLNGAVVNLTFQTLGSVWTGSFTRCNGLVTSVQLGCDPVTHTWGLAFSGPSCQTPSGPHLSGTSGPSPNLSGTFAVSNCCAGNITATITRT